ncbi:YczE/YyaS/YitT family protein [Domibacillus antri]|uniref:YczE/YyaS/YitT family protein n=1 Tax=Domibacillus antri TaxID=1714264 RepID=UPI000A5C77BB|nr:YitT family protein [Domibacillus antri]
MNKKGNIGIRLSIFTAGLFIMSFGIVLLIEANVGATPWDALHVGLYQLFGLTVGTWTMIAGFFILMLGSLYIKEWPQIGAYLNMVMVGLFVDFFLWTPFIQTPATLFGQWMMFLAGVVIHAYGMSFYISARLGAGPRDHFMLALVRKKGWKVSNIRRGMEVIVMALAFLIGGPVSIGTFIFSLLIGTMVGISLPQCERLSDIIINHRLNRKEEV